MTSIEYKGKEYTLFEVERDGIGELVAHESFGSELISEDGVYTDEEAQAIDESIYFYVDDCVTTDEEAQEYFDKYCF